MVVVVVEVELPMRKVTSLLAFAWTSPLPKPSNEVGPFVVPLTLTSSSSFDWNVVKSPKLSLSNNTSPKGDFNFLNSPLHPDTNDCNHDRRPDKAYHQTY